MHTETFKKFRAWITLNHSKQIISKLSLQNMIRNNLLVEYPEPSYYVYQIKSPTFIKTGITVTINTKLYEKKIIKHESVIEEMVKLQMDNFKNLKFQVTPIILACEHKNEFFEFLNCFTYTKPLIKIYDSNIEHSIWSINDNEALYHLNETLNKTNCFYVIDGHHRLESIYRLNQNSTKNNYIMATIFPMDSIQISPFHRKVTLINKLSDKNSLINILNAEFKIIPSNEKLYLPNRNQIGLFLNSQWFNIYCGNLKNGNTEGKFLHYNIIPFIQKYCGDYIIQYLLDKHVIEATHYPLKVEELIFTLPSPTKHHIIDHGKHYIPKFTNCSPKLSEGLLLYQQEF